jgi:hypothetical protein
VVLNDQVVFTTDTDQDTFDPIWNETTTTELGAGDSLVLAIVDDDFSDDDYAYGCDFGVVSGQLVRLGDLTCSHSTGSITASIGPR